MSFVWVALPLLPASVAASASVWDLQIFVGPWFALAVALASANCGLRGGTASAVLASVGYDLTILPPLGMFNWDGQLIVPAVAFGLAAVLFVRNRVRGAWVLTTVADIVDWLGGVRAAAKWADVSTEEVERWIIQAHIPPGWHYRLSLKAQEEGVLIRPAVFGIIKRR
jgi:hypothetical protein